MGDYENERRILNRGYRRVCGVDEVGRGALFGPVVSGAVILNPEDLNPRIDDSKKLSHSRRLVLAADIYERALAYSIGWCWNDEIDSGNILEATRRAMRMAVARLQVPPDYVLVDGPDAGFLDVPAEGIVKGDEKSLSIAAASIIAKVFRDQLLVSFSRFFPGYAFEKNKGYPTQKHINMVSSRGITEFHRTSFACGYGQRK